MTGKDITRIMVGKQSVSVVGLRSLVEQMAESHKGSGDKEAIEHMMDHLGRQNYIPASAAEEYGHAFLREFRKFMGQPFTEPPREGLDIKVLGAGCNQCDKMTQLVMEVLSENRLSASVEHVTDFKEIAGYGLMGVPALVIDGKAYAVGSVPPKSQIEKFIAKAAAAAASQSK
jgi:hypothetical protein